MATALRKPDPISFEGNCSENLRVFFMEYDIYVAAAHPGANKKTHSYILLNLAGRDAIERARTFTYADDEDKEDPDILKAKFKALCEPKVNMILLRHNFNSRFQRAGESFQSFLVDVRNKADACDLGDKKQEFIRDRIVVGLKSEQTRKALMREAGLTLEKAIEICELHELADETKLSVNQDPDVNVIKTSKYRQRRQGQGQGAKPKQKCAWCGYVHDKGKCPAYGKDCTACGRKNHFASVCLSSGGDKPAAEQKFRSSRPRRHRKLHEIDWEQDDDDDDECEDDDENFVIETVEMPNSQNEINVTAIFEKNKFEMKIDSGAKCNVISLDTIQEFDIKNKVSIKSKDKVNLISYSGDKISTLGTCVLECDISGNKVPLTFQVVNKRAKTILGLKDALKLELITIHPDVHEIEDIPKDIPPDIYAEYKDLFSDLPGKLPVTHKMKLNPDVEPVIRPPRRVPVAMKSRIKAELDKMEANGIIQKVTEPTEWVSSMVAAEKKGTDELRICIDPRDLNQAIMRPHHPLKTVDDIASDIPGATVFSKLDAKSGFWHIPLDDKSSFYTTFNTIFGRYRFLRLPYGVTSGSEVFQETADVMMEGYPCKVIVDDILVYGRDKTEHDRNLKIVLDRCREIDLHLNIHKCKFRLSSIGYVGNVFTSKGLLPDPEKVRAIQDMPTPTNVTEVQRFLGMTNYLSRYINHHSDKSRILRELTHRDVPWHWDSNHQQAFETLKNDLCNPPLLSYFDPDKAVTLTCDASKFGLGAACLQEGKPIAFASRALTTNEIKWAQIEKELLGVVFACTKFHDFVYGKSVIVESDHKPLETIFKKPILKAPARLQNMLLKLQKYNITIVFKKGKEMYLADTLSRAFLKDDPTPQEQLDFQVMDLDMTDQVLSPNRLQELTLHTSRDDVFSKLSAIIVHGNWPAKFQSAPSWLQPYYHFRDELSVDEGLIFRGTKILIPTSLRQQYIAQLHKMHQGADSTFKLAREYFYWPKMHEDIHYFVDQCAICNASKPHQQNQPLNLHPVPSRQFQIVGTDLFEFDSKVYIVLVDSYSGFFDFEVLKDTTSKSVIDFLKRQFSIHGSPSYVLSDNASYYISQEFQKFAQEWSFQHVTSSPNFPQSNGLAERGVRSAKSLLSKCQKDNTDVYYALLLLRNVPRDNTLKSPVERLFSRKTNIPLPTASEVLTPRNVPSVQQNLYNKRLIQKKHHDKTAKPLTELITNQTVRLETDKGFNKLGYVKAAGDKPDSYIVQAEGRTYRRNRKHLLPVAENKPADKERPIPIVSRTLPVKKQDKTAVPSVCVKSPVKPVQTPAKTVPTVKPTSPVRAKPAPPVVKVQDTVRTTRSGRVVKVPSKFSE